MSTRPRPSAPSARAHPSSATPPATQCIVPSSSACTFTGIKRSNRTPARQIMDHRRPIIRDVSEAETLYRKIEEGAVKTAARLRTIDGTPMDLLRELRFEAVGHDPLT